MAEKMGENPSDASERARRKCREFLAVADEYRLGNLETEQSHPASRRLSQLAGTDLRSAVGILHAIDTAALTALLDRREDLEQMARQVEETIQAGDRIFLCGCGATGRLSLVLETLWRERYRGSALEERVVGFMAGGDLALIKSIENFEDFPAYAERQLVELGFGEGDLLISTTEGGETPFVIGATEKATEISKRPPFFLYCNPDDLLCGTVERSRRVILSEGIRTWSLLTGPMAITGSTRMQASTVLMAAVGLGLFFRDKSLEEVTDWTHRLIRDWERIDLSGLDELIRLETECYEKGEFVLYETGPRYGISVLTDTTERAPTFSLLPFENRDEDRDRALSWCYLFFPEAEDSREGWRQLLRREPRTLEWSEIEGRASEKRLLGFDFSRKLLDRRRRWANGSNEHHRFRIARKDSAISLSLLGKEFRIPVSGFGSLGEHLLLKMVLNIHSTLVMGRLGRYEGNVMTWVRPSNNKLIDRSIRYIDLLLRREGEQRTYEEIAARLFEVDELLPPDRSLVLAVADSFTRE